MLGQTSTLNGFSLTGLVLIQTADRPFNLLDPAIGRMVRSDMLRMWSVLSHITSILLMAGAAYRNVTLLLGMIGIRLRNEADKDLDPWRSVVSRTEYWSRKPREVPTYKQPTLMSNVSTCTIMLQSIQTKTIFILPFLQLQGGTTCSTKTE